MPRFRAAVRVAVTLSAAVLFGIVAVAAQGGGPIMHW
jgi:hypothetical protein